MNQYSSSVMIALLPTDTSWCKIEYPHLTLVYAGEMETLKRTAFNELAKDAVSLAMISNPVTLTVSNVEVFGTDEKVDAFRFQPSSQLRAMRRFLRHWNASEHEFTPHVTIGPVGSAPEFSPQQLVFDRIAVAWGNESYTFWLKP